MAFLLLAAPTLNCVYHLILGSCDSIIVGAVALQRSTTAMDIRNLLEITRYDHAIPPLVNVHFRILHVHFVSAQLQLPQVVCLALPQILHVEIQRGWRVFLFPPTRLERKILLS